MINCKRQAGFTLVEMIIYIAIVSIILVSISSLMLDIMAGRASNYAKQEINYNSRYLTNRLIKDIHASSAINSLAADTLVLVSPGGKITYHFDSSSDSLTRQIDDGQVTRMHNGEIAVGGSFADQSFAGRTQSVQVNLDFVYKNPSNVINYQASNSVSLTLELQGRR